MTSKVSGLNNLQTHVVYQAFLRAFCFLFFGPLTEFLRSLSRGSAPVCQFTRQRMQRLMMSEIITSSKTS